MVPSLSLLSCESSVSVKKTLIEKKKISLNIMLLLLLVNFVSGFSLESMYISLIKSIKSKVPDSSPWFWAFCTAAIIHRNHFFHLYQEGKSSESKVKLIQASNYYKRVLEAPKLPYANKTKESITSQKLCSRDFWWIDNSVLNKGKSAIPPLFNGLEVLSSASNKAKLFPENFSKNSNLVDSGYFFTCLPF